LTIPDDEKSHNYSFTILSDQKWIQIRHKYFELLNQFQLAALTRNKGHLRFLAKKQLRKLLLQTPGNNKNKLNCLRQRMNYWDFDIGNSLSVN